MGINSPDKSVRNLYHRWNEINIFRTGFNSDFSISGTRIIFDIDRHRTRIIEDLTISLVSSNVYLQKYIHAFICS